MGRYINADKMIADTEAMRQISEAITIDGIIKYINEHATSDVEEAKHGDGRVGMMTENELKQHIFELSVALDSQSAGKDYPALRRTHYNNIKWIQEHGLDKEYYDFWYNAHFGKENEE